MSIFATEKKVRKKKKTLPPIGFEPAENCSSAYGRKKHRLMGVS